jgi:hypothetical protein
MSDQSEIAEAFRSSNDLDLDIPAYATENYNVFVNDINNQSYSNGQIIFSTEAVKDKQIVLSESFAAFPLSLTSSGTAYDANTRLAIKTSLLSLIQGVRISTTNGTNIVDETSGSLPIINNLRLLTEEDLEFVEGEGRDLMFFGPDKFNQSNVDPGVAVLNAPINPVSGLTDVSSAPADNNVVFNKALSKRVSAFYTTAANTTSTIWTIMAYIPLKYIHPYFRAMAFPLCNNPLQINFNISGIYNQTFLPWETPRASALPSLGTVANPTPIGVGYTVVPTSGGSVILTPTTAVPLNWYVGMPVVINCTTLPTGGALGTVYYWATLSGANTLTTGCICTTLALAISVSALGTGVGAVTFTGAGAAVSLVPVAPVQDAVAAVAAPTMSIVGTISDRGFTQGACRIYFKTVTFRPNDALELAGKIKAGYKKSITFKVCDLPPLASATNQTTATLNTLLTSSVSRPVAVWCLFPPTGSLTSTTNSFPGTIGTNLLTNANLMINGLNFYPNQLQSQYDFYKILKKRMPEKGQLITYNDFLQGCNPYLFNIASSPASEAGIPCQLQLTGTLGSGGNSGKGVAGKVVYSTTPTTYDMIVLIERLQTCIMNISESSITTSMVTGFAK